jgi:hypothetical protein
VHLVGLLIYTLLGELFIPALQENTDLLLQADLFEEHRAAPHFSRNTQVFLDKSFSKHWTDGREPVTRPALSLDITRTYLYLWGLLLQFLKIQDARHVGVY